MGGRDPGAQKKKEKGEPPLVGTWDLTGHGRAGQPESGIKKGWEREGKDRKGYGKGKHCPPWERGHTYGEGQTRVQVKGSRIRGNGGKLLIVMGAQHM